MVLMDFQGFFGFDSDLENNIFVISELNVNLVRPSSPGADGLVHIYEIK